MAARYWVGGTGTWDAASSAHWAAASGGAGGASVPTVADDVFFDAASGAGTVTLAAGAVCRSFDCVGYAATIAFPTGASLEVNGPLFRLSAGMTWSLATSTAVLTFRAAGALALLTFAGKTMGAVTFDGVGGSWQLQDTLTTSVNRILTLTNGSLDLNAKTLNLGAAFSSSNANVRELKAAGATINLTGTGTVWTTTTATNFTQTGFSTLTVNITNTAASAKTIGHSGTKIGTVNLPADAAPGNAAGVVNLNAFAADNLNVTGPKFVALSVAAKQIGKVTLNGSPGNPIDFRSATPGSPTFVTQTARGTATYSTFTDCAFFGPTMFAGAGCVNGGNNLGMRFGNAAAGLLGL